MMMTLGEVHPTKLKQFCTEFNWAFPFSEDMNLDFLSQVVTEEQYRYYITKRSKYDFSACNQSENVVEFPTINKEEDTDDS